MKEIIALMLFIVVANIEIICGKKYEKCELAQELYATHEIPREEIYKHLCIASTLRDTRTTNAFNFIGMYRIGVQWWCGKDKPGGGCNVTCSALIDDDIADDVACANIILNNSGLSGWRLNERACARHKLDTDECLEEVDVFESLLEMESSTVEPERTTISTTTSTTSSSTTTSSTTIKTTSSTTKETTTTTRRPSISTKKEEEIVDPHEDFSILSKISLIVLSITLTIAVVFVFYKRETIKRYLNPRSSSSHNEFENILVNNHENNFQEVLN
ncbi:CLUMA_CG009283, isoform A [Clunio marinus]|uniref:lysozyme n=1 Tax=Clunio marinus TaxID=568069 RepID=A0A1J1I6D9_9DIPT|nr:CLUMA_CG009283, isoform A [Clunio marinus]